MLSDQAKGKRDLIRGPVNQNEHIILIQSKSAASGNNENLISEQPVQPLLPVDCKATTCFPAVLYNLGQRWKRPVPTWHKGLSQL